MEPWSHKELSKKLKSFTRQNFWKFRCTKKTKTPIYDSTLLYFNRSAASQNESF